MAAKSKREQRRDVVSEFEKLISDEQLPLEEEMKRRVNLSSEEITRILSYEKELKRD